MPLIVVRGLSRAGTQGKLHLGAVHVRCALGRSGRGVKAGEGDGVTPRGRWAIRHVFYRADRLAKPLTGLPVSAITPDLGWCDAAGDANYNRPVRLPYAASHERMWREDGLYDIVAVLGFNDVPRAQGRGSAIFLHLAHEDFRATEGCIAVSREAMLRILRGAAVGDAVVVE